VTEAVETLADQIAARGREALVDRLRTAYADAASAHSDIVSLDNERIESLVQAAADNADGLQWRRALANVASEQLGISLAEALTHPAVARAQEIVGAPSYEASLAELIARPVPRPTQDAMPASEQASATQQFSAPAPPAEAPAVVSSNGNAPVSDDALEAVEADDAYVELLPEPNPIEEEPGPEPVQPERMIDEPEEHGATGELDVVEADDTVLELLPAPEPIEYEDDSYDEIPQVIEEPAPPVLEQVPYEPELEQDEPLAAVEPEPVAEVEAEPVAETEPEVVVTPAPDSAAVETEPALTIEEPYVGEPTQVHEFDPEEYEELPVELGELPEPALEDASYGAVYGSEHTDYPPPEDDELRVTAFHLGGVANLPAGRDGLGLRLSESGLDILQPEGDIIGRLHWNEIDALEVNPVRGRLRRQVRSQSRIVVRTKHGDASFEIPGLSSDELEARVDPLISRFGGG
jgi:hypothetical protein